MDGFSYVNIFATKGMEYLLTIAFFLILIPFWVIMSRQVKVNLALEKTLGTLTRSILKIPRGVFVTKQHTWAFLTSEGKAKIGVDDLIQHLAGEVSIRFLKNPGDSVGKGDVIAELTKGDRSLVIKAPVSGEIGKINPKVMKDPALVNADPYARGWLYTMEPQQWADDTRDCYLADSAESYLSEELNRFRDFLQHSMASLTPGTNITLQDGGELSDHVLSSMPEKVWEEFQKEFLD